MCIKQIESKMKNYHPEKSIASWGFRWVGSLPNVKVILSGMTTMEQVQDNIDTFANFEPLNDEEYKIIGEVRNDVKALSKVDCTSCNYCMPCPHGVDIPLNFRMYNGHAMYKVDGYIKWAYGNTKNQGKHAELCIECGECVPKCPQQIEIPTELGNFVEYMKENGLIE